jgi:hypothetical protein
MFIFKKDFNILFLIIFLLFFYFKIESESNNCNLNSKLPVNTVFIPISQGQNLYTQYHIPLYLEDNCLLGSNFSITYRYQEASNNDEIIRSLLQYNPLLFLGKNSGIENRPTNAIVPENFGLSATTNTELNLKPYIKNGIIDLQFVIGGENLWLQANIPIVRAEWKLNKNQIPNNFSVGKELLQDSGEGDLYVLLNQNATNKEYLIGSTIPQLENVTIGTETGQTIPDTFNYPPSGYLATSTDSSFSSLFEEGGLSLQGEIDSENSEIGIGNGFGGISASSITYGVPISATNYTTAPETNEIDYLSESQPLNNVFVIPTNISQDAYTFIEVQQDQINQATSLTNALNGYTFGNLKTRNYNKINLNSCHESEDWSPADILLKLGYDFFKNNNCHFGVYLRGVIPTGTEIDKNWNEYILTPVVGNGRHFEFGVGLTGHKTFNCGDSKDLTIFIEGYIDHVLKNQQFRTADLIKQPMSRYALIRSLQYNADQSDYIYTGNIFSLGDVNSGFVNVSIDLRSEFIFDFIFDVCSWKFGCGYAFSGQTEEKIKDCESLSIGNSKKVADNFYFGYAVGNPDVNLIADMSNAAFGTTGNLLLPIKTGNDLTSGASLSLENNNDVTIDGNSGLYLYGESTFPDGASESDIFILPDLKNSQGLMNAQILNRIFLHIDYTFDSLWMPTIGIIGSYGFGSENYFTANYWDLGIRMGVSF